MNHEQAFLQAIRETPHDDAPRLIYADWLEEQGGAVRAARADFIRIQCRLDELPDDDPVRDRLEDEAADLLAEHEAEWTQPLHGLAEDWRFSRGFVEHIRIRGENLLTHAERLFDFAPLHSLHLLIPPKAVPHLAACPQLQWVETLDFRRCSLNDRSLQQLLTSPHLRRLTALDLAGNSDISTPSVQALIHSPIFARMTRLDLSGNWSVGDRAFRLLASASHAEKLRALSLSDTRITAASLRQLFQSSHLSGLTDLNIASINDPRAEGDTLLRDLIDTPLLGQLRSLNLSKTADPAGWRFLFASPQVSRLQKLYLRGREAERAHVEALVQSPYLKNLTTLDLGGTNLYEESAQLLADSPNLAPLNYLDLNSNSIYDTGAKAIAESPYLTRLTLLDLGKNGIGGPGLQALASSANLARLKTLNIGDNYIGVESVDALAESPYLSRLLRLDLSNAHLQEGSARALASSARLARLTTLLVGSNQLGDNGAEALAQSSHLQRLATLDLSLNRIGIAGAKALANALGWRRLRKLDLRGNVFTDRQETLLRERFGETVVL